MEGPATIWRILSAWLTTMDEWSDLSNVELRQTPGGGRGLFVAQTPARVQIPAEALINLVTLRPLYPPVFAELSATCLISLHLALQHDRHTRSASPLLPVPADHFRPFLNSLPVAFPTTPLVWALQATENLATDYDVQGKDRSIAEQPISDALRNRCRQLLAAMPPSVRGKAAKVEARFRTDWTYLQSFWLAHRSGCGDDAGSLQLLDYAIAWLNVNSRCIYFDVGSLGTGAADNLTLCPIIDMMNHCDGRTAQPARIGEGLVFNDSPGNLTAVGQELLFTYGPHECPLLMAEYGFCVGAGQNPYNHLEIDLAISALFEDALLGRLKRSLLEDNGYWGDFTIGSDPTEASFRVLVALRLLHLDVASLSSSNVTPWLAVVSGMSEIISPANEEAVQGSIRRICRRALKEAEAGVEHCVATREKWGEATDDEAASLSMLQTIWAGESEIAREAMRQLD